MGFAERQVVNVITEMFTRGCDFVVVIENDRPWEILAALPTEIAGVAVVDQSDKTGSNTAAWIGGDYATRGDFLAAWTHGSISTDKTTEALKVDETTRQALWHLQKASSTRLRSSQRDATVEHARQQLLIDKYKKQRTQDE